MSIRIIASKTPAVLQEALASLGLPSITVEAEFGAIVVKGSLETRAHHVEEYKHLPSPCTYPNQLVEGLGVIGLSHMDLDSLGGALAAMGTRPGPDAFWTLAGWVDVNGPHKLSTFPATEKDLAYLHAFWAWSEKNKAVISAEEITDLTEYVEGGRQALTRIFEGDADLLRAGEEMKANEDKLNEESFRYEVDGIIVREHENFVNHLYATPGGYPAKAVVTFSTKWKSVTVSVPEDTDGFHVGHLVRCIWGIEAGGHQNIGGSPRGKEMTFADAARAAQVVRLCLLRNQ
jgi:hypothetical protein